MNDGRSRSAQRGIGNRSVPCNEGEERPMLQHFLSKNLHRRNEMTLSTIDESQRKAARVAGFTLLFAMAIVIFGEFYISSNLIVPGNAAETARNIMAHETLFRINIACDLIYVVNIVGLLAALYVILKPVNRSLALVAAFCRLIYALMWVVTAFNMLGALRLLGGGTYLSVFEADRLQ